MSLKILVVSASTGNGHVSAAIAITEEAERQGLKARHVDAMDIVTPGFRRWYRGGYETLVRRRPRLWGHLYRGSDRPYFYYQAQTGLDTTFCAPLDRMIERERPDWVVCTHSLPQPRLARIRRRVPFKMAIVVTDLYVHRMWLRGQPDLFFVPQPWSQEVLLKRLPETAGRIHVTGIPVNGAFAHAPTKAEARVAHSMSLDQPVVLMSSGGIGGGPLVDATLDLAATGAHVIVVAGRNEASRQALEHAVMNYDNVTVKGHVDQAEMASLMAMSDVLVGKPGGLTTFEALTVGIPFVVYWPFLIPGQEEGNAEFLQDLGAGVIVREPRELGSTVNALLRDGDRREAMRVAALAQAKPNAAPDIVRILREQSGA
jgi:processive 1,2-diacylglycerol beta-glucosyltransferase